MLSDIRIGVRMLLKDRGFTAAAVVTLALGIAATSTVFTLVNGLLLRDMPFADPKQLVEMTEVSYLDLRDWQAAARTFEGIAGVDQRAMNISDADYPAERVLGSYISANALTVLGRRPALGREFRADDDRDGAAPVVILSHDLWRARYRSDPAALGRTIRVNGTPSTIVGVMPDGFQFPMNARLWQPLAAMPAEWRSARDRRPLDSFGRLRRGVTVEQAQAELQSIVTRLAREYPDRNRDLRPAVAPYRAGIVSRTPAALIFLFMMGAVTLVLLIACANVANLLLARAAVRSRDVSLRMSIGATRWRIIRQLLVESMLLAAVSGAAALALSSVGIRLFSVALSQAGEEVPYWLAFPIDIRVFVFLASICLGTTVLIGLVPALQTARTNLVDVLGDAARGSIGHRRSQRWSGVFVVGQLALALVLLTAAGAVTRNLLALVHVDVGIPTSGLVHMAIELPASKYPSGEQRFLFYRQLDDRLAGSPDMRATLASAMPNADAEEGPIATANQPIAGESSRRGAARVTVGPRYFETLGIELLSGRLFGDGDSGRRAAIVNRRFVEVHLGDGVLPLGSQFRIPPDGEWLTVVGVVGNVRENSNGDGFEPVIYLPFGAMAPSHIEILVRSGSDLAQVASTLRTHVRALDLDLPLYDIRTVDDEMAISQWPQRLFGSMFAIFAGIAVVLAAVGLYAVTAYAASHRTQEIGVRVALGAQARQIWWLVTRRAGRQLAAGLVIGGAGAAAVGRVLPALVFGTSAGDALTLILVAALMVAVASVACFVPARRAMRLDPLAALRAE
jgi:putative ABC transport system permease protein